jgi:Ser/Thr protein kinase RdoA (MazF antagonist)
MIENLEVTVDRGPRLRLVLKDLGLQSLLAEARRVRPHFIYEPSREIAIYQRILDPKRFDTPVCYGAIDSADTDRHWLFLERVSGPLLWQMGRLQAWVQAAQWLARFHAEFAPLSRSAGRDGQLHLLRYDAPFLRLWLARAEELLHHQSAADSAETRRRFWRLADRYDRVINHLLDLPTTLIHGEFFPSNIIVRRRKTGLRICPIDWELAAIAPGLFDLATLTSGEWPKDHKATVLSAYHDAGEPDRGRPVPMADLTTAVEYCQLHLCIQMMGWAANWSPPEHHARNWLQEALRLASKLGL